MIVCGISRPSTIANISRSMLLYLLCVSVAGLNPFIDASTSSTVFCDAIVQKRRFVGDLTFNCVTCCLVNFFPEPESIFFIRSRRNAVLSENHGTNCDRYVSIPKKVCSSSFLTGVGMFLMSCTFFGSGLMPSRS